MLTGAEIKRLVKLGEIRISDFSEERLNPNSYNLRLGDKLLIYDIPYIIEGNSHKDRRFEKIIYSANACIDSKKDNPVKEIYIPSSGLVLMPGVFYLGTTVETTYAGEYIPCISGRSSMARLGLEIHRTAGFGDIGFNGKWTLEMTCPVPLKIYPNQEICQIYFEKPDGETTIKYKGRYQNQDDVIASRMFMTKEEVGKNNE